MGENGYRFVVENLIGYMADGKELYFAVCFGNSNATKPTNSSNGEGLLCNCSACVESDTGNVYFYNEYTSAWVKQ